MPEDGKKIAVDLIEEFTRGSHFEICDREDYTVLDKHHEFAEELGEFIDKQGYTIAKKV